MGLIIGGIDQRKGEQSCVEYERLGNRLKFVKSDRIALFGPFVLPRIDSPMLPVWSLADSPPETF